jgi:hypothetical protein
MKTENERLVDHLERESRKRNVCRVNERGTHLEFTDEDGDRLTVEVFSTGATQIAVRDNSMNDMMCNLSNRATHELRDFLNRRFPNATGAQ